MKQRFLCFPTAPEVPESLAMVVVSRISTPSPTASNPRNTSIIVFVHMLVPLASHGSHFVTCSDCCCLCSTITTTNYHNRSSCSFVLLTNLKFPGLILNWRLWRTCILEGTGTPLLNALCRVQIFHSLPATKPGSVRSKSVAEVQSLP